MKGSCKRNHVPRNSPLAFNQSQYRSLGNNFGQSVLQTCSDSWEDNHVMRNSPVAFSQSQWRGPRNNTERGMEDNGSTVRSSSITHLINDNFHNISIFITFFYNLRLQVIIHFARAHHILQHNMQQVQQWSLDLKQFITIKYFSILFQPFSFNQSKLENLIYYHCFQFI